MKRCFSALLGFLLVAGTVHGAALTAVRNTPSRSGKRIELTVTNGLTIYAGAMVGVDAGAEAVNAADTAGIQVVGRALRTVDNSADGKTVKVDRGIFRWANGDTVSDANLGDICYVEDNQTVSVTNSGSASIIAGIVVDVDSDGVWVDTGFLPTTAGSFTTLAASGATTLSSTLAVTGVITTSADVDNNATGGTTADPDFSVDGYAKFAGVVEIDSTNQVDGALVLGNTLTLSSATLSHAAQANPTQTVARAVYFIESDTTITQSLSNASSGQYLILQNIAGTNVIISDSDANIDLGGSDITLGATDNVVLLGQGTTWYELSTANN